MPETTNHIRVEVTARGQRYAVSSDYEMPRTTHRGAGHLVGLLMKTAEGMAENMRRLTAEIGEGALAELDAGMREGRRAADGAETEERYIVRELPKREGGEP
ncbi:MAG: hypothetical protein ACLFV3_12180 [Phycisphaeraceae bacterium]